MTLTKLQSQIRSILEAAHSPQYVGRMDEIRALSDAAMTTVNDIIRNETKTWKIFGWTIRSR